MGGGCLENELREPSGEREEGLLEELGRRSCVFWDQGVQNGPASECFLRIPGEICKVARLL